MISITATYIIQPAKRDDFIEAIHSFLKNSAEQVGINANIVGEVIGSPNTFFFYAEYADEQAFSTHEKSDVMELMKVVGMCLADTPEAYRLDIREKHTMMSGG